MSTGGKLAILAALPREVHGFVRGAAPVPSLRREGVFLYRFGQVTVVAAGMGAARVSRAFAVALEEGPLDEVISAGLAGACTPDLAAGTVIEAGSIVDARTGERFRTASAGSQHVLVTAESIASVAEKTRLAASYGADMVDMEAATVARLAEAHGVRFRAIKGISDAHDFELASLSRFASKHGHFRTTAFALHTALRPHHWRPAAKLGRESNRALSVLGARLQQIVDDFA